MVEYTTATTIDKGFSVGGGFMVATMGVRSHVLSNYLISLSIASIDVVVVSWWQRWGCGGGKVYEWWLLWSWPPNGLDGLTEASKEKFKANVGIGSGFSQLHQASNLFHIDERVTWVDIEDEGKVLWVRAKEDSGWIFDFVEDDEEESDSDDEIRDEGLHDESVDKHNYATVEGESDVEEYPPGFTPTVATEVQSNACNEAEIEGDECLQNIHDEKVASKVKKTCPLSNPKEDREESICSRHFKKSRITAFKRLNVTTNERFGEGGTNH
ncbi:hypothetical protein Tco_1458581 [Tanacetum coccineum]